MNNNTAAESEYAKAKTAVWWDIENCPVPKGCDALVIAQKLSSALMNMNYSGPLSIYSYGNTDLISNSVQQALSSTGISLNHVPSGRKDASDKKILVDMFLWVVENPPPANLMLISGDGDFSDALHRLRMKRYNILLVHPQEASTSLVASAKNTWLWKNLLARDCPLTQCQSSQVVDNGIYPYESEISSQDVSEHVFFKQPANSLSASSRAAGNKSKGIYVPKASIQLLQQEIKRYKLQKNCNGMGESAWFCKECNVACESFEVFTRHLLSKEHAAQLVVKWGANQNLELLSEPENMAALPSDSAEKEVEVEITNEVVEAGVEASVHFGSFNVVKKQAEASFNIESVEDNNMQSRDAQECMKFLEKQSKELMERDGITSERNGRDFWQVLKESFEREGVTLLNVDRLFNKLRSDFLVPKEVRECFDVILKKLEPTQNEIVIKELEGMLQQGLEVKSGEPENLSTEPTEHLEEDMNKKKQKRKNKSGLGEYKAEGYVCSICSVICNYAAIFESHLKGRKHIAAVKKHTKKSRECVSASNPKSDC